MRGQRISYSSKELNWVKSHAEMARRTAWTQFQAKFNRPDVSLTNFNSLCKRNGWLTGRTGQFAQGQTPPNKGKKMPFNPKSAATQFKKGRRPHNYKGDGHEMTCPKDGYVYMIVRQKNPHTGADTSRILKHKYLWEQAKGPLPDGMCLKCLDGDKTNCDPANWELIPRALLPRLNGRFGRNYDAAEPEIKPAIMPVAKLEHLVRTKREVEKTP